MPEDRRSGGLVPDEWIGKAMFAGLVAGIVFVVFEVAVAALMGSGPLTPLRMIGAILLGQGALQEVGTPLPAFGKGLLLRLGLPLSVAGVGLLIHSLLSAFYGGTFGAATWILRPLSRRRWALVASAAAFGILLWVVNFRAIAPFAFPWFTMANPVVQFLAHAFFFGTTLGLLLAWRLDKAQSERPETPDEHGGRSSEQQAASSQGGD